MRQLVLLVLPLFIIGSYSKSPKLLPFQIVKFPNDPCGVSGSTKNGTCYTSEECSEKGGKSEGSCAEGYGVCCSFTLGCGESSVENNTYFEVTSPTAGQCSAKVCPCNENICQIRLDLETFVITGPATVTLSSTFLINGAAAGSGLASNKVGQCLTDSFSVSNSQNTPTLCGSLTGEHLYVEANEACNDLDFVFGEVANSISALATRSFKIKTTQLSCTDNNLPPKGCTQYFWGNSGSGTVQNFGFSTTIPHLAGQKQTICVRRESGNCQICYSAAAVTDVSFSGKGTKGLIADASCCGYGTDGMKTGGYDCLMIPGAEKATGTPVAPTNCGGKKGLVTAAAGTTAATICSKTTPFRLEFYSDSYEIATDTLEGAEDKITSGFKVNYFQNAC